jgi:hypothetical protein
MPESLAQHAGQCATGLLHGTTVRVVMGQHARTRFRMRCGFRGPELEPCGASSRRLTCPRGPGGSLHNLRPGYCGVPRGTRRYASTLEPRRGEAEPTMWRSCSERSTRSTVHCTPNSAAACCPCTSRAAKKSLFGPRLLADGRGLPGSTTRSRRADRSGSAVASLLCDPIRVVIASRRARNVRLFIHGAKCMRPFLISLGLHGMAGTMRVAHAGTDSRHIFIS